MCVLGKHTRDNERREAERRRKESRGGKGETHHKSEKKEQIKHLQVEQPSAQQSVGPFNHFSAMPNERGE